MKISVKEESISGERALIVENAYFKSIIIPGKAMFPATYLYKPSGNDVFLRRENIEQSFSALDGLYECLPWVGDSKKRGESKGYLKSAVWKTSTSVDAGIATLFSTEISYPDSRRARRLNWPLPRRSWHRANMRSFEWITRSRTRAVTRPGS